MKWWWPAFNVGTGVYHLLRQVTVWELQCITVNEFLSSKTSILFLFEFTACITVLIKSGTILLWFYCFRITHNCTDFVQLKLHRTELCCWENSIRGLFWMAGVNWIRIFLILTCIMHFSIFEKNILLFWFAISRNSLQKKYVSSYTVYTIVFFNNSYFYCSPLIELFFTDNTIWASNILQELNVYLFQYKACRIIQ